MTEIPEDSKTETEKTQTVNKWKILTIILAVLLILFGGTIIIWGIVPNFPADAPNSQGQSPQGSGLVIDPNAGEYVPPTPAPGVKIPGFGKLTIPANTKEVIGINLYNPEENEGWYYLTFKLSLLDENEEVSETLYESQLVPPGLYLQDITLSRGLAKGEYEAVMHVQPYRVSDMSPTNNANLRLTIIVK